MVAIVSFVMVLIGGRGIEPFVRKKRMSVFCDVNAASMTACACVIGIM